MSRQGDDDTHHNTHILTNATPTNQRTPQATGQEYSSRLMRLTEEQFKALPPITFVLDDGVEVRPEIYNNTCGGIGGVVCRCQTHGTHAPM